LFRPKAEKDLMPVENCWRMLVFQVKVYFIAYHQYLMMIVGFVSTYHNRTVAVIF